MLPLDREKSRRSRSSKEDKWGMRFTLLEFGVICVLSLALMIAAWLLPNPFGVA